MSSHKFNMVFTTKPTYSRSLNTISTTQTTRSIITNTPTNTNRNYASIGNILYAPKTSCKSCGGG